MTVFDCDLQLPGVPETKPGMETRSGPATANRLPPPPGYGVDNYNYVFRKFASFKSEGHEVPADHPRGASAWYEERCTEMITMMDDADVRRGILTNAPNSVLVDLAAQFPDRILGFVSLSPYDGMRAVREFERLVQAGAAGLFVLAMFDHLPASDRRYYPLYAKCVELDVPVRIYSGMTFANDLPYDLGHPRHLDQIAVDFPELRIVAGLGGWPWVNEMVALVRRHPNLYLDTGSHHPKYFAAPGSGWEMLMRYGNTVLQDKIMVGLSWLGFGAPMKDIVERYGELPLKDAVLQKWLGDNAREFFRLP